MEKSHDRHLSWFPSFYLFQNLSITHTHIHIFALHDWIVRFLFFNKADRCEVIKVFFFSFPVNFIGLVLVSLSQRIVLSTTERRVGEDVRWMRMNYASFSPLLIVYLSLSHRCFVTDRLLPSCSL